MNELIDTYEPFLELLTAIAVVIVAIVGIYVARQIRSLRRGIDTRNERAAKAKAIEYSGRYFSVFVPLDMIYANDAQKALPALNELNVIASAFVTGVADESVGFKLIGPNFCDAVVKRYDSSSLSRSNAGVEVYQAIADLYQLWSPRVSQTKR